MIGSLLCLVFVCRCLPVSAQDTLVLAAVEGGHGIISVISEVLSQAYQQLGIQITINPYPGLRGLHYSNYGIIDGEAFRIAGIDKKFSNLIRVEVSLMTNRHYLFVKSGNEFVVEGWDSIPKNYLIGFQRGIKVIELATKEYQIQTESVSTATQLLQKLNIGRNDAIILPAPAAAQNIQQLELKDIIKLEPPINSHNLYHYLHTKHAALVPKITAVLKAMEANGDIQKIHEQIRAEASP
jgi:polar amino acid transport system substrate-binding protein